MWLSLSLSLCRDGTMLRNINCTQYSLTPPLCTGHLLFSVTASPILRNRLIRGLMRPPPIDRRTWRPSHVECIMNSYHARAFSFSSPPSRGLRRVLRRLIPTRACLNDHSRPSRSAAPTAQTLPNTLPGARSRAVYICSRTK